ncbi:hypothetical protein [Paenibacillus sp. DMB20]|uniref:hypothetical protein n=1 Tax=Paenibacillus sp. DMB20 TaxID=1642570 RepID=UPI000627C07B|nr:hypothetical protein [Paenibacillus sp. DMB20]KKO54506.1 hypothetical protein XI25_06915 [Paenibacillus sp. DMB20]
MSVINDIVAIEAYIKALFPTATTGKQDVPAQPPPNSYYVRMIDEDRETETRYHYRVDRAYQIVHVDKRPDTVLANMDKLSTAVYQTELIGPIRINAFSISPPAKTENGLFVIIGVLDTSVREARIQPEYPKINHVNIRRM